MKTAVLCMLVCCCSQLAACYNFVYFAVREQHVFLAEPALAAADALHLLAVPAR